jgi:hypothetical protein
MNKSRVILLFIVVKSKVTYTLAIVCIFRVIPSTFYLASILPQF